MDVLSEVLRIVRLSGAIHFIGEFTSPWAFSSTPSKMLTARLNIREGVVTPFHIATEGGCWVIQDKLPPTRMEVGDVVLFPRGDQHVMANDPAVKPVPINEIYPDVTATTSPGCGMVAAVNARGSFAAISNAISSSIRFSTRSRH
jgi:hypothetical protein